MALVLRLVFFYGLVYVDPFTYADSAASIARGQPVFDSHLVGDLYFTQYIRLALTVPAAVLYRLFGPSDAASTAVPIAAASIARGQPVFDSHLVGDLYFTQYIRLALTVPAAVLYRLFGPSDAASTAVPIAASLATSIVAFALARRVGGDLGGVIAAALVAVFPPLVANSTQFLPDTMLAFFASVSMLAFISALDDDRSRRQRWLLYGVAGVAFAWAFYGRPTAVGLLPPFACIFAWRSVQRRHVDHEVLASAAGAGSVVGAANLLLTTLGAGLFEDLRLIAREGRGSAPGALQYTDIDWTYAHTLVHDPMFWPFTVLVALGVTVLFARNGLRRTLTGPAMPLLALVAGQYLYFEFLMRLPGLYTWWKEPRYIFPMVVPALALAGAGLGAWLQQSPPRVRRATAVYIAGALLFISAWSVGTLRQDHAVAIANRVDAVQLATAAFLQTQPPLPVFTWNDDFARPLAYDMSLNDSSAYERHEDRGIVRNRFDSVGRSIVQADSFVVLLPGDDEWTRPTAPEAWWTLAWEMPGQVQVYRVPATPPAIGGLTPLTALAPLGAGVSIQAAGQSSAVVLPERSLILAVAFDHPAPSAFALRAATNCAGRSPGRSVTVPSGATDARLELPVDAAANGQPVTCALQVAGPDDRWATVGQVDVAALLVDEPEGRYTLARPPDGTGGWQATYQPFFRGGGAVIAVAPYRDLEAAGMTAPHSGDYWVDLAVYDYGTAGVNTVVVHLGEADVPVSWGGGEAAGGVRHLVARLSGVPVGASLRIEVGAVGQEAVVIDAIALVDAAPDLLR